MVFGIGITLFIGFLGVHFLSSGYEGTHSLIIIGFLLSIVGGLWGHGRERARHYYDRDPAWQWLATSLYISVGGVALVALGIYYAFKTTNYRIFAASVIGVGVILLGRWLARKGHQIRLQDKLWPDRYSCPNCGHGLNRYERSCLGCGAVVWSMMRMKEGVYELPPEKRGRKSATYRRPNQT